MTSNHRLYKRLAHWFLHLSMALILLGGIVTSFQEKRGILHLRNGETTHEYLQENADSTYTPTPLPFYLTLEAFCIESEDSNHVDYVSQMIVRNAHKTDIVHIRMNKPLMTQGYRIIQASYDTDLRGTHLAIIHDPIGTPMAMIGFSAFILGAIWLLCIKVTSLISRKKFSLSYKNKWQGLATIALATILMSLPLVPLFLTPLQPILRTPLLYIHVSTVIVSYILLILTIIHRHLLSIAVLLLAMGISLGAIWGSISWGTYWSWDPKETWALITLILYALPLHSWFAPIMRQPSAYRLYNLLCLATLLITYLGVNFLMQSKHSYL